MSPDSGAPRLARILVFALVTVALSAGGHTVGGGGLPPASTLVLLAPPILLLSVWLSSRQRGPRELLAVLAIAQGLLHVVYHWAHAASMTPVALHPQAANGHLMHGHLMPGQLLIEQAGTSPGVHTLQHAAHGAVGGALSGMMPSPAMLTAHIVATLATAWVMARGEQALWRMAHRLHVRLWPVVPIVSPPPLTGCLPDTDRRSVLSRGVGRVLATRGPPLLVTG